MVLPVPDVYEDENDEPTISRAPSKPPPMPGVGDTVRDKYRLTREVGSGGMGRIFAAEHVMLGSLVAMKFLHAHLASDPIAVERFAREARAAAMLRSPHVARILDVDALPSGELYIVMEYLEGTSLETVAQSGRGLPIADAVKFIVHACDALAEAHAHGIVHRDVKPANLFVTTTKAGDRVVKVLDFGLAKSALPDVFPGGVKVALGTPEYMSPEQVRGASVIDARTDIWSLGVTLYELLAGRRAFAGESPRAIFTRIDEGSFVPLRALRPEVSPELAAIVERCLSRDPGARFASVTELAAALEGRVDATASSERLSATMPSFAPVALERPVSVSAWSVPASAMSVSVGAAPEVRAPRRQMFFAALAGPALIGVVAAAFAFTLTIAHAAGTATAAAPPPGRWASGVVHLTAKADVNARGKALAVVIPARRPRAAILNR